MKLYELEISQDELASNITRLIDDGIRKGRYSTYGEWKQAVTTLLGEIQFKDKSVLKKSALRDWADTSEATRREPLEQEKNRELNERFERLMGTTSTERLARDILIAMAQSTVVEVSDAEETVKRAFALARAFLEWKG